MSEVHARGRGGVPDRVDRLQGKLGAALVANSPGSGVDHVLIVLPSYSVSESILSHYGDRIPSLEHRYLNALLVADRIRDCEVVYLSTRLPVDVAVEAVLSAIPEDRRRYVRDRVRLIEVDDGSPRSVAAKLLDRPDLLARLRDLVGPRPALIEPWNVTDAEIELALALDVPINGTRPELRHLGFKSEGRRLLRAAGVPVPRGREDVRSVEGVAAAIISMQVDDPTIRSVVVKLDDSGAGDGNVVLDVASPEARASVEAMSRRVASALSSSYVEDLAAGGVVEERIEGTRFASPSAQVDIRPDGAVNVLATHEQVLGGQDGQVYLGCRFPADPAYAPELARHAQAIGQVLADRGAMGRFSVDFVAASDATTGGGWRIFALEVNLRKGGTTHPYAAMRSVIPGRYDSAAGTWRADDGSSRCYSATDNLVDPAWTGLAPSTVVTALADENLLFDPVRRTGVIPHMLSGLAIDGRFGFTAIAETPEEAEHMDTAVRDATRAAAARQAPR